MGVLVGVEVGVDVAVGLGVSVFVGWVVGVRVIVGEAVPLSSADVPLGFAEGVVVRAADAAGCAVTVGVGLGVIER